MPCKSDDDLHFVVFLWVLESFHPNPQHRVGTWFLGNGEVGCGVMTNSNGFLQLDGAPDLFRGDASRPRFISATVAARRLIMEVMLVLRRLAEVVFKSKVGRRRCLCHSGALGHLSEDPVGLPASPRHSWSVAVAGGA